MIWLAAPVPTYPSKQGPPLQESASYGSYIAKTYFDPASNSNDAYFEILKGTRTIYRLKATEKWRTIRRRDALQRRPRCETGRDGT